MEPLEGPEEWAGPYRLLAELGAGGMGRVYLASAPDGGLVAVKRIALRFADDPGFRARFGREVDACRRVSGAYTASVITADPDATTPWLASVYVPGPSLTEALEAVGVLPEDAAVQLAARLASALVDIHRAGLIHRDLKPSNVLLAEDGLRVIDFGIVRAADSGTEATLTTLPIGSPAYMSPEQARLEPVTTASDLFNLGVVMVVATGRHPFHVSDDVPATVRRILTEQPDLSGVPARLRPIVERCLAKDPAARPTPAQVLSLLAPIPPTSRPWPSAVYDQIARRRAEVDRLLDGSPPEGTQVLAAEGPSFEPPTMAEGPPEQAEPVAAPARRPPVALWVGVGVAVLALAAVLVNAVGWDRLTGAFAGPSDDPTTQQEQTDSPSPSSSDEPAAAGPVGTIVGAKGMCLDVLEAATDNGTPVGIHSCNGGANQQWTVAPDGTLRSLGKCLDVTDASPDNGARVQIWDCHGGANQVWTAREGTLADSNSGRCLDIPYLDIVDGTQVQIWDCVGGDNQLWQLPS